MALIHLAVGLVVGVLLLGAGYLLRFQHAVAIVPFFNPASFDDPRKTAERLGLVAFLLGLAAIAVGVYLFV